MIESRLVLFASNSALMPKQRTLRLAPVPREIHHVTTPKLLSDLLKRHSRRVMADITECPTDTIPAHIARLELCAELIRFVIAHDMIPDDERRRSDKQLLYAVTLADVLECLVLTKQSHRAPAFVTGRDAALDEINRKLDLLAGLFAKSPALNAALDEMEEER